ncbi:MAG TPA: hypothetical protein VMV72_11670 [Verrucomicrobiae bacterium]|nr:hypothetical protein [Verrucomicrobiae bacterium]
MSIAYRIDKGMGFTLTRWDGVVTASEFLTHVQKLSSDPDWPPARRLHLTDLSTARLDSSMDEATVEKAAHLYGERRNEINGMKVAIVAGDASKQAAVFERVIVQYGATAIVFNHVDAAATWLGLKPDTVQSAMRQVPV